MAIKSGIFNYYGDPVAMKSGKFNLIYGDPVAIKSGKFNSIYGDSIVI